MQVRQLKDGRWQVIRDDGVCFSLTYEQWQALMAQIERAQTNLKIEPVPIETGPFYPDAGVPVVTKTREELEEVCPAEPKLESLHEKGEIVSGFEMITDEPKQDQEMPYTVACRCGKLWINLDADERYCRSCGFDLIGDPVESGPGPVDAEPGSSDE